MSDISTGQIFTPGQQGINAPQMNNIIGLATINSSFITTKNPITNLQNNDNFVLARNDGTWARITGSALADGLVNAEPNFARIAVGPVQAQCPIINGDMQVWQRTTSIAGLGAAAHTYVSDKWSADTGGALTGRFTTAQQLSGLTGTANYPDTEFCTRITITTSQASLAATDNCSITQRVEQQLARVLYDNATSLSILLRCSITGTFCVAFRNNNAGTPNRSYIVECPITSANVWQRFTFPAIATMPTGVGTWGNSDTDYSYIIGICIGSGTTFQTTAGAWNTGNFIATANQTNLFATNGATLDITLVQHEAGNIVTPFYWTPFDGSIIRCKRYFRKSYDYLTTPGTVTNTGNLQVLTFSIATTSVLAPVQFDVEMRPGGAGVIYSPSISTSQRIRDQSSATDLTVSAITASTKNISQITTTANFTASNQALFHYTFDSDF